MGYCYETLTESQVLNNNVEIWGAGPGPVDEAPPPQELGDFFRRNPVSERTWVRRGGPPGGLGYDISCNFDDPNI